MILAFNATTGAVSEYAADWHGVVEHDGELLALESDGVYAQSSAADADVPEFSVQTGDLLVNGGQQGNLYQVTPLISAEAAVSLSLTVTELSASRNIGPFELSVPDNEHQIEWPSTVGRGHSGSRYSVSVSGTGRFSLDWLMLYVRPIHRRRR